MNGSRGGLRRAAAGLCGLLCWSGALALTDAPSAPYYLRSQNPFLQLYGVPAPQGGRLTALGDLDSRIAFSLANHADKGALAGETITLDGESYYLDAVFRYGVTDRWEVGIDLPLVAHRDGVLDNAIEGWHDLVGLSNRTRRGPSNQLHLAYSGPEAGAIDMTHGSSGIGDVRLTGAYAMTRGDRALALRGLLKLPTGDADGLQGSGATDLALSVEATDSITLASWSVTLFGQAGAMLAGEGDVLAPLQEDLVPFGSAGLAWRVTDSVGLQMQLAAQGAQFDSALDQLGRATVNLAVGATVRWRRLGLELDVALVEDLVSDATPDFGMFLALTHRPGSGS